MTIAMTDATGLGDRAGSGLADAQANRLLQHVKTQGPPCEAGSPAETAKIEKSAREFESILLGSWLQQAEKSFAQVPGGDEGEDEDPGKEQFQSMAMQSLAGSLAASGGIGIGKMIAAGLHGVDDAAARPSGGDH